MALVRLSDAVVSEVYESYTSDNNPETTVFFQSGVAVRNALLDEAADEKGFNVHIPFWKDIDPTIEPNYSNDDPAANSTPNKIGSGQMQARKAYLNQSFSDADLVTELAGSDPMQAIRNRFGTYWQRQWQRRAIAIMVGIAASNVVNNSGDMVVDVSIADGNNALAANLFGRAAFVNACFTMGDRGEEIMAIAVHSVVYKRMINNDDIDFIPDSQGKMTIPTYLGRTVIVDDSMPVVAGGTSGFVYTSILFGAAALGYGEGTPQVPSETRREPSQANGGGVEIIFERNTWLMHPFGFNWTETTVSAPGLSPTLANLRLAANWTRATSFRKNVPIAFLKTNG